MSSTAGLILLHLVMLCYVLRGSGTFFEVICNIASKRLPPGEFVSQLPLRVAGFVLRRREGQGVSSNIVCGAKNWAHPCHRLAFMVNNWFGRGSAYVLGHSTHFVKGQFSPEKISNTGAFPLPPL